MSQQPQTESTGLGAEIEARIGGLATDEETAALLQDLLTVAREAQQQAESASRLASDAQDRLLDLREENATLRDEIESLHEENESLRGRIEELHNRTDLMTDVAAGAAMKPDQRAAVCIQTLYNEAYRNKHLNAETRPTASMDYKKGQGALGGGISRSSVLRSFERADELVDGDVVRYIREDRSSEQNSRLVIDLSESAAPETVAGQEITEPEVDQRT